MEMSTQHLNPDEDTQETAEWLDALRGVVQAGGAERARYLTTQLSETARGLGLHWRGSRNTPYEITMRAQDEPPSPGGSGAPGIEQSRASIIRWNALAMV